MSKERQQGFTIIELLAVIAITEMISIVSVAVLVNSQLRGTRATTLNRVRQEGSFVLDQISFTLRNARYVLANQDGQTCTDGMSAIRLRMPAGETIEFYLDDDGRIASNSGTVITDPPAAYLTSSGVLVNTLSFSCQQDPAQGGAVIRLEFDMSSGDPNTVSPESYYHQLFSTQIYVRSFQ
jgi:type II secretory pathway pseudopilin PulG